MTLLPFLLVQATHPALVTPYAQAEKLGIGEVRFAAEVPQYSEDEFSIDATGTYSNPFDPEDVAIDAIVTAPSGKQTMVPGFLYRAYRRSLVKGEEKLEPVGAPTWRVRVCPVERGEHLVHLTFRDHTGQVSKEVHFRSGAPESPGFVRISPRDRRYFEFDSGAPFFPIGANVGWAGPRGTFDYDDWFADYGKVRANYGRLWLSPSGFTLALEQPGKSEEGKGMGQFDLANAWRVDHVLTLAEQQGLYLMLCIDSYNILRNQDGYPAWERSPQNRDNGGPLRIWSDFWTDPEMSRLYQNKLRYLVARYGASSHVFAWEFWNEVDMVRDYSTDKVREWHQKMGGFLRTLDPYRHLQTTSFSDPMGDRAIDLLPEIDFVQTHQYNSADLVASLAYQQSRKSGWGKPHYVGEVGADSSGPRSKDDPQGLQIHDPLWLGLATGASGGAMPWWWDSLIAPNHLYSIFGAAENFVYGIDWPEQDFRQTDVTLAYADQNHGPARSDLVIDNGAVSWTSTAVMHPQTVRVNSDGYRGDRPAGILHGLKNHPRLHNPLTLHTNLPSKKAFFVEVGDVSGYGGAKLQVLLDGKAVLTRDFPSSGEGSKNPILRQYAGAYRVDVPRGRHTVKVQNVGADWLMVDYRFENLLAKPEPPLSAWSVVGNNVAIVWLRLQGRSWKAVAEQKRVIPPCPPTVMGITGLAAGRYRVEYWDTWAGKINATRELRIGIGGKVRIPLPSVAKDIALKLVRVGNRN